MNAERIGVILRDLGCTVMALSGMAWQIFIRETASLEILTFCLFLLGIPGGAHVWALRAQAAGTQQPSPAPTGGQPPPSPGVSSLPPPSV